MNAFKIIGLSCGMLISTYASASICAIDGRAKSVIPSSGVAGFTMDSTLTGCSCDYNVIWIDTETHGGRAMYSALLSAKALDKPIKASIQDGQGQGSAGNTSITYRYWASCKLLALEIL